jgi:hypothetical protein
MSLEAFREARIEFLRYTDNLIYTRRYIYRFKVAYLRTTNWERS